ncbi:MAG: hypothetical protein ACOCP8_05500 [archaeon]
MKNNNGYISCVIVLLLIFVLSNQIMAEDISFNKVKEMVSNKDYPEFEQSYEHIYPEAGFSHYKTDEKEKTNFSASQNINDLFTNRKALQKVNWSNEIYKKFDEIKNNMQIAAHLYNRIIFEKRKKEIYDEYIYLLEDVLSDLEEKKNEQELAEYIYKLEKQKHLLEDIQNSLSGTKNGFYNLIGEEISLEEFPDEYPENIEEKTDYNINSIVEANMYDYKLGMKKLKEKIFQEKLELIPDISSSYDYSFDENESKIGVSIKTGFDFDILDFAQVGYRGRASGDWRGEDFYNDIRHNISLDIFSSSEDNFWERDFKKELNEKQENLNKEESKQRNKVMQDLKQIKMFQDRYQLEKILDAKYTKGEDEFSSLSDKFNYLIDKLEHKIKQEENKFNYSYLFSFLKAQEDESSHLIKYIDGYFDIE